MYHHEFYENARTGEKTFSRSVAERWVSQGFRVWHHHSDGGTTYMGNYWG